MIVVIFIKIQISEKTYDELKRLGYPSQSIENIIIDFIKHVTKCGRFLEVRV